MGNEAVNIGSKMAARYKASIGDVLDDAMMLLSCGRRALFLFSELLVCQQESRCEVVISAMPFLDTVNL